MEGVEQIVHQCELKEKPTKLDAYILSKQSLEIRSRKVV